MFSFFERPGIKFGFNEPARDHAAGALASHTLFKLENRSFPLVDFVRVDLELLRDLGVPSFSFGAVNRDFRTESRTERSARFGHRFHSGRPPLVSIFLPTASPDAQIYEEVTLRMLTR